MRKGQRIVLFRFGYYEIENEPTNGVSKGAVTTLPRRSAQASVEALTSLFTQLDRTRSEPDMANLLK